MIISFAWTTPALLAGAKTMTRRDWTPAHAAHFHAGDLVDAYDKSPRARGRKVATIRITRDPWQQRTRFLTTGGFAHGTAGVADWQGEGIEWMQTHDYRPPYPARDWREWWDSWVAADELVWVVEFELVEVLGR